MRTVNSKDGTSISFDQGQGMADPEYGRVDAQSFTGARFQLIPEAGHLPQIEQPGRLLALLWEFADSIAATRRGALI